MSEVPSSHEKRRPDRAALVIAPVLFVLAAVIWWDAGRLAEMSNYSRIGPATVPHVVAIGLALLAIWTGFEAWRGDFPEREPIEMQPVVFIVAGLAGQMLLLKTALVDILGWGNKLPEIFGGPVWGWIVWALSLPTGFSIATGVLFALTAFGFGRRKLWISLPIGIALSFVVFIIFGRFLQLSLPAGPLEHLFF